MIITAGVPSGVAFLLLTFIRRELHIYVVKELKDKLRFSKWRGVYSPPIETYEEKDGNYIGTIQRLLPEEVNRELTSESGLVSLFPKTSLVTILPFIKRGLHPIPGKDELGRIHGKKVARRFFEIDKLQYDPSDIEIAYGMGICLDCEMEFDPGDPDSDIDPVGWVSMEELRRMSTRVEVNPIIEDFLFNYYNGNNPLFMAIIRSFFPDQEIEQPTQV